jgi:hypothetical protein
MLRLLFERSSSLKRNLQISVGREASLGAPPPGSDTQSLDIPHKDSTFLSSEGRKRAQVGDGQEACECLSFGTITSCKPGRKYRVVRQG